VDPQNGKLNPDEVEWNTTAMWTILYKINCRIPVIILWYNTILIFDIYTHQWYMQY
jgi:hypothetical protein